MAAEPGKGERGFCRSMSGPAAIRFQEAERFVVGTAAEEVFEPGREAAVLALMPLENLLGHGFQRLQMGGWVAVAEGMVCDDLDAVLQKGGKFRMEHGVMLRWGGGEERAKARGPILSNSLWANRAWTDEGAGL